MGVGGGGEGGGGVVGGGDWGGGGGECGLYGHPTGLLGVGGGAGGGGGGHVSLGAARGGGGGGGGGGQRSTVPNGTVGLLLARRRRGGQLGGWRRCRQRKGHRGWHPEVPPGGPLLDQQPAHQDGIAPERAKGRPEALIPAAITDGGGHSLSQPERGCVLDKSVEVAAARPAHRRWGVDLRLSKALDLAAGAVTPWCERALARTRRAACSPHARTPTSCSRGASG